MESFFSIKKEHQVLILSFNNKETQTLTMSGASCYYEDSKFYKKYIYKYHLIRNDKIQSNSYDGHNLSLKKIIKYYELSLKKNDILYEELNLYKKLIKYQKKNYRYIITKCEDDKSTLEHEKKHVLFYFNKKYRNYIKSIWESLNDDIKNIIIEYLNTYHKKLYIDEFQAYITTEPFVFLKNNKNKKKENIKLKKELLQISSLINNWLKIYIKL